MASPHRPCPTCRQPAAPRAENRFAPFCSERCRLVDLGKWFDQDYRIAGPPALGPDLDPDGR